MALSAKFQAVMFDAWADKKSAKAFLAAVAARSALSAHDFNVLRDVMAASGAQVPPVGAKINTAVEVALAVVSGANLSLKARKKILIAMGDKVAGNALINVIQSTPQSSPTTL